MTSFGTFASLSPSLLARKGGAKPAMRRQFQPIEQIGALTEQQANEDDLGWNDLGEPDSPVAHVVPLVATVPVAELPVPEVIRQQAHIVERIATPVAANAPTPRRSALAEGRRAAFTLRLDAARHLDLRLACTLTNRSAQQLVLQALDNLLATMPEVADLAQRVRKRT